MAKRLRKQERRRQVLDTAIGVFAQQGFRGTTTKRLAAAAGVSEATIYLHFPTKKALYKAILEAKIRSLDPMLAELAAADERSLKETLRGVASAMLRKYKRDRTLLRLLLYSALEDHELARSFFRQLMQGSFRRLTELLEERQARGELRKDLDLQVAGRAFVGMIINEILWRELIGEVVLPRLSMERVVGGYVDTYLKGISAWTEE